MAESDKPQMSTAHSHYMLDKQDYKHELKICYTYYFVTEATVARTRLSVKSCALLQENNEQHQDKLYSVYIISRSNNSVKLRRSKKKTSRKKC
jgi:hypothetical protein